jgi:LuxR family transcriptional regulator, maltose regulon positive regulatory protein
VDGAPRLRPRLLEHGAVARPRLAALLSRRWDARLVVITAGPGFGKSTVLAAAGRDPIRPDGAREAWVSCEPADAEHPHLARAVTRALGARCGEAAGDVARWVWARAPDEVGLLLDDVHHVGAGTSGAAWLRDLIDALPANGHVVAASRRPLPFPLHAWAMEGRLVRIGEEDLRFDPSELLAVATESDVDPALIDGTGGWPALVALRAHAGADLVDEFLWDEVLAGLPEGRVQTLARFHAVGGGDDAIVAALTGSELEVDSLLDGVPLSERREGGWGTLHALWGPVLDGRLSPDEVRDAQLAAVDAHRACGRRSAAVELAIRAEAWDDVVSVLREIAIDVGETAPEDLRRWHRSLPPARRFEPAAWLISGIEQAPRDPQAALVSLDTAAAGFRSRGDHEAELVTLSYLGLQAWWENDVARLIEGLQRVDELHALQVPGAHVLHLLGRGAGAHLVGEPADVLAALDGIEDDELGWWLTHVQWLRSVAHRRRGDIPAALAAATVVDGATTDRVGPQAEIARLRAEWLAGRTDEVLVGFERASSHYRRTGDRYLAAEVDLDLAAKRAFVGDRAGAAALVDAVGSVADLPGALVRVLDVIARSALAVAAGDEEAAAGVLRDAAEPAIGSTWAWYWPDRAALSLPYVLLPEHRAALEAWALPSVLRHGVELGQAVVAARTGDLAPVRALRWPQPGVVAAHLPLPWLAELVAAGAAARNPAPPEVVHRAVAEGKGAAAERWAVRLPVDPGATLGISVLGPLAITRGGVEVTPPELRRRRVRELLCMLVADPRRRRAELAEELWPDAADPGSNLRANLTHLQRVLEPGRPAHAPPYFLRTDGEWLVLPASSRLEVDAWELSRDVDAAQSLERDGDVDAALRRYLRGARWWRGEPFADVDDVLWVHALREQLRRRHVLAALRAGELLLAAGDPGAAQRAAERALDAEPCSEPAHQLVVRALLAAGDRPGATRAVAACAAALETIGVAPSPATVGLVRDGGAGFLP